MGCGMGLEREAKPPGFYNFTFHDERFIKKVCFLSFEEEKQNFTTFSPCLKIVGNIQYWNPPVKDFFQPHGYSTYTQRRAVDISQFLRIFRLCPKWFLCTLPTCLNRNTLCEAVVGCLSCDLSSCSRVL